MKTETRIQKTETTYTVYVANDGKIFQFKEDCLRHEKELARKSNDAYLIKCEEAQGWANCDGDENGYDSDYTWYYIESENTISLLEEMYGNDIDLGGMIGQWVCIEETDFNSVNVSTLEKGIDYATRLLSKFGYIVDIRSSAGVNESKINVEQEIK